MSLSSPAIRQVVLFNGRPTWMAGMDMGWDFAQGRRYGSLDPTDTHASDIYAPNAAGVYTPFGANVLTRTDLGLQTVPTRTQLVSAAPYALSDAGWSATNATKTAGQVGPTNLNNNDAALITCTASGSPSFATAPTGSFTSGTTYTISEFVKAGTQSLVQLTGSSVTFGASQYANFNLATGVVTASAGLVSSAIETYADGWKRISITLPATGTSSAATAGIVCFIASPTDTRAPTVTLSTTFYVGGIDASAGAFAVPPILTAAATANGNQQVISLPTQLAVGVAGVVQYYSYAVPQAFGQVIKLSDGTDNNSVGLILISGTLRFGVNNGGVGQAQIDYGSWPLGLVTAAFAVGTNFAAFRVVGGAALTDDTVVSYPSMNRLALGGNGYDVVRNTYQMTRKLALKFGSQDAGTFAQMYALAQIAAAS